MTDSDHCCYILFNNKHNATYNGYTNNLGRRIRQHNGYIKGGAVFTTRKKQQYPDFMWQYLAIVASPQFTHVSALRCEWLIKYPLNRKPRPKSMNHPVGRLQGLCMALQHAKFSDHHFVVFVHEAFQNKVSWPTHERIQFRFGLLPGAYEQYKTEQQAGMKEAAATNEPTSGPLLNPPSQQDEGASPGC